jgi:hypothetical protein
MASLADADLTQKLRSSEGQKRLLTAQRRLLALRLQLAGLDRRAPVGSAPVRRVRGLGRIG